jgi:hypothetical protein
MSQEMSTMDVFIDLLPNQPRNDKSREQFRAMLTVRFEEKLPQSVERIWELPPIILKYPQAEYIALLVEARNLYVDGHYYSCVAMCGIVGERIVKDLLRASIYIKKDGAICVPQDKAFDQLERVEISAIVRFLKEVGLLTADAGKASEDLVILRNQYAHARGKEPNLDALKSLQYLHVLIEDTVSFFKDFAF